MKLEHLDVRRLLCPMPVIKVQAKIESMQKGDLLEVVCTDPGVVKDIPAWCNINNHTVKNIVTKKLEITLTIEVSR